MIVLNTVWEKLDVHSVLDLKNTCQIKKLIGHPKLDYNEITWQPGNLAFLIFKIVIQRL